MTPLAQNIPYGHCHCGCGRKTSIPVETNRAINRVAGVPMKYRPGHTAGRGAVDFVVADTGYETCCWLWQRSLDTCGYGHLRNKGRLVNAHRYYREAVFGKIADGLVCDHLCRVRRCIRPDHIDTVSPLENCRRGKATKLTRVQVLEMKSMRLSGATFREIGARYGVSGSGASDAITGRRRKTTG